MSDRIYRTVEKDLIDAELSVEKEQQVTAIVPAGPNALVQMAIDKDFDLDRLQQLIDMRDREESKNAEKAFIVACNEAKAEMPAILFDKKNEGTNSWYSTLAAINTTIDPIITKHGLTVSYDEEECIAAAGDKPIEYVKFKAELCHIGGHKKTFRITLPMDDVNRAKNRLQSKGSTTAYGRRYLKLMMFDLTTMAEDNDGQSEDATISDEAVASLNELLERCRKAGNPFEGQQLARFLKYVGVQENGNVGDIRCSSYVKAVAELTRWTYPRDKAPAKKSEASS
jgi:hypothetical protein